MKFISILLLTLMTLGCGYGSMNNYMNGASRVTMLAPASASAGGGGFMLTVNGSGFSMNSVVYWNSTPMTTTFVTGNQVVATIPGLEVASRGTARVYVLSNGMTSNTVNFSVN